MQELKVRFTYSGEEIEVFIDELKNAVLGFLDMYGDPAFLGPEFGQILRQENQFSNLLDAAGMDETQFFSSIIKQLEPANHHTDTKITVGNIELPKRFLLPILEVLVPGDNLSAVKDVETYEQLTNLKVPDNEREALQQVIEKYPVRLSKHVIRQARLSKNVAYQFMPFVDELDESGLKNTWIGQFHKGLLEQMYQNRPIFVLHMSCPVYCRFCFRKHKDCRNLPTPKVEDVVEALDHIQKSPKIKEIVLTGGEPLLNMETLTCAVEGLEKIPHIQTIRIASRCISYYPQIFYAHDNFWLNYFIEKSRLLQQDNKRIEIATHFIHPDEISHYSLDIISKLVSNGVGVYTQTPFLKDCNDTGKELTWLYNELRGAGSEIHYVYIPCSPIQGNKVFWTPISAGWQAAAYMRGHLSDRAIPIICTATKIGKIDWNTSGWAVEKYHAPQGCDRTENHPAPAASAASAVSATLPTSTTSNSSAHSASSDSSNSSAHSASSVSSDRIWIRTPYTDEYFKEFAPQFVPQEARTNQAGTLDSVFLAQIGDESLFLGPLTEAAAPAYLFKRENLQALQQEITQDQRLPYSIVDTGIPALKRPHLTTVEVDIEALEAYQQIIAYISRERALTDVILTAKQAVLGSLDSLHMYVKALQTFPHIKAIRIRSLTFAYRPELYTSEIVDIITGYNNLTSANSIRIELETQFIHSSELTDLHGRLIRRFLSKGVTVYNNILLLSGINDNVDEMKNICYKCRQIGIELLLLYTAGMPVQDRWNASRPVDATTVIHLATHLRRYQSGREVPLYAVKTPLGDADFNLTAKFIPINEKDINNKHNNYGDVYDDAHPAGPSTGAQTGSDRGPSTGPSTGAFMQLLPYTLEYYRALDPAFSWPQGVTEKEGHPVVPVKGLTVSTNKGFFFSR